VDLEHVGGEEDSAAPLAEPTGPRPTGAYGPAGPKTAGGEGERIAAMLRRASLGPHPEHRAAVLAAIVAMLAKRTPQTARELRVAAAEQAGTSRAKVGELLRALSLGGALLGIGGDPLPGLGEPVGRLVSEDVAALDAFCQRAWRANIAAQDPTLLASPAGERAFRATIGPKGSK
jgi:hypothetical protein